jgi:hypothetical protein
MFWRYFTINEHVCSLLLIEVTGAVVFIIVGRPASVIGARDRTEFGLPQLIEFVGNQTKAITSLFKLAHKETEAVVFKIMPSF